MLNFLLADSAADKRYHPAACRSALPDNVRLSIAEIVFSPADVRATTQERGASAPRGFTTATAPASVSTLRAVSREFAEAPLQSRYGNHGGLTPAAPGRMCVCASQKSFSHWQTSASQYKSGGRKPPVGNETSRGLMSACAGNLFPLRKSGRRQPPVVCSRNANPITAIWRIAIADAVCNPTAG
jgi:hypothetical protein